MERRDIEQSRIERQLLSAIAVAVQRRNALAMLAGYTQSNVARANGVRRAAEVAGKKGEGRGNRAEEVAEE